MKCHDCQLEAEFDGEEVKNGVIAVYQTDEDKIEVFKCKDCYSKNKELKNFQECEVYSRVVGYLRPVRQWHLGKQEEYQERKEYEV